MRIHTINDVEYRAVEDANLFLDIHRPKGDATVPCIVLGT